MDRTSTRERVARNDQGEPGGGPTAVGQPQADYRALVRAGFSPAEAGNLAGMAVGLGRTTSGWSPDEISHLLFTRWRADRISGSAA